VKTNRAKRGFLIIKSAYKLLLVFTLLATTFGLAHADSYHYENILVGERAAGMGGAYTAVSDDPSGLYHNPGGIVYSQGNNLSASANAYHASRKTYDKATSDGRDWKREASVVLPNFFGVIQKVGKGKVGLSSVVPDSILEDQDQTFNRIPSLDVDGDGSPNFMDLTLNFNNEDNTTNVGLSYARELTEGLSAGLTVYAHLRNVQTILNQYILFDTGQYQWENLYIESNEWGFRPIAGVMWTPADKVSLGLTASKIIIVDSETTSQVTRKFWDEAAPPCTAGNVCTLPPTSITTDDKREYATNIDLGAAYFYSDGLLLAGDISYYTAQEDFEGERLATWNAALGTEYYMTPSFALRGGIFSNHASTPELKSGGKNQPEHVNLYGASLSLSHFGRNSSVTLGGSYSYGTGEAQVVENITNIQDVTMDSYTLFLSTAYSY
jgi:long-chain fatty acid transport protein